MKFFLNPWGKGSSSGWRLMGLVERNLYILESNTPVLIGFYFILFLLNHQGLINLTLK